MRPGRPCNQFIKSLSIPIDSHKLVEQALRTRKSTIYPRRPSTGDKNCSNPFESSIRPQRLQTTERPILPSYQSFSDSTSNRPKSSSSALQVLPVLPSDTVERVCLDQELGTRPDAYAQAEFVCGQYLSDIIETVSYPLQKPFSTKWCRKNDRLCGIV